jgi:hypothetical protein
MMTEDHFNWDFGRIGDQDNQSGKNSDDQSGKNSESGKNSVG